MSEQKPVLSLLADHMIGDAISDHNGVSCYPAIKMESDEKYIVKIIAIPAVQTQLEALLLTGAYPNKEAALNYFKELTESAAQEAQLLQKLSKLEGFLSYDGWELGPMPNGDGYRLYLLGTYKRTLARYLKRNPMTHLAAINLGLDLCAALSVCRRMGYLYVDLKPENVFLVGDREYRIGDIGFVGLDSLKYASLPDRYISEYTAPEIIDAYSTLNETLDTYAAGLILYQVYNNGELPESPAGAEQLPPPAYADYELAEIILKACHSDPAQRWQDPTQMGQALVSYMQRNTVNDVPIIPPVIPEEPALSPETEAENQAEEETAPEEVSSAESIDEPIPAAEQELPAPEDTPADGEAPSVIPEPNTGEEPEEPELVILPAPEEAPDQPELTLEPTLEETQEEMLTDLELATPEEPEAEEPELVILPIADDEPEQPDLILEKNLSAEDETVPSEEDGEILVDAVLTEEVSAILAQADELIAHQLPDPVVAPEAVELPEPDPIEPEEPVAEEPEENKPEEPGKPETPTVAAEEPAAEVPAAAVAVQTPPAEIREVPVKEKKKHGGLIALLVSVLVLLLLACGAFYYYENFYLQLVQGIRLEGSENNLTVYLDTEINNSLLTVHCTDTYGNKLTQPVSNNTATFTDLKPGSNYKITLVISGFHELIGTTSAQHTTATQTNIISFTATAGDQDGTVILRFDIQGPENTNWVVRYSAPGVAEQVAECNKHMATITGLEPGKLYTFKLESVADLYVVGTDTIEFTAPKMIYPENLAIHGFHDGALVADWTVPAGVTVSSWTVRCYNNDGVNVTMTVTEPKVAVPDLNPSQGYTIEVKAEGMMVGSRDTISANSVTFKDPVLDDSTPGKLVITWYYEGTAPANGWRLLYTINGETPHVVECAQNTCTISPLIPGAHYEFAFEMPADVTVFGGTAAYTVPEAPAFNDFGITAEDLSFRMCFTPTNVNWKWFDLLETAFADSFAAGEKASFVIVMDQMPELADGDIQTLFIIRDSNGQLVGSPQEGRTRNWHSMWSSFSGRYGTELDMPTMPQESGEYTVEIYFNNALVTVQPFTVK